MKINKKLVLGSTLALACFVAGASHYARAEETTGEKIQNSADDAVKDTKKVGRKMKKNVRDATGNSSVKEDAKDTMHNAGDSVDSAATKTKRKVD